MGKSRKAESCQVSRSELLSANRVYVIYARSRNATKDIKFIV